MAGSTFHALLIGIDYYFPNKLSNGAQYRTLGGCVNDIERVGAMLMLRLADPKADARLRIRTLLAPSADGQPTGDASAWPTADNIRRELAELAEAAQPGDQVYIHYAGHGGRVSTLWKDVKGEDGIDEALVPMDIGRTAAPGDPQCTYAGRYIRDVELARYLDRLASKQDAAGARIVTTLVFDSCHSGGATRGTEIAPRCATGGASSEGDPQGTIDRPGGGHRELADADRKAMADALQHLLSSVGSRGAGAAHTPWLPPARSYVLLAACRDVEAALEVSVDGAPRAGVLTSAYLEALAALGSEQSWKTVYDRVVARVHTRFPSQTPQLVGDIERQVFGVQLLPIQLTPSVTAVDADARSVTLDAGKATMIATGTEVGIYRPGETDFSVVDRRIAVATVTDVTAFTSHARLDADADVRQIQTGAPAVIQGLLLRRSVELYQRSDLSPVMAARQDRALDEVRAALATEGRGFLEICPARQTPHYQVTISEAGQYEICDPQGKPLAYLEPRFAIGDGGAARGVVAQLRRLGRYHTVLDMHEPSALAEQLDVQLLLAPPGWTDALPVGSTGGTAIERTDDAYSVPTDTWVWLRIRNKQPDRPVNIALLDLSRNWEIEMIVPNPDDLAGKRYETIAGTPCTFAFRMYTSIAEATDVLKLFMAVDDVDFRRIATAGVTRSASRSPASDALGQLLDSLDALENRTREAAPARSQSSPWAVREMRFRTFVVRGAGPPR